MTRTTLILRYTLFALVAMAVNLMAQRAALQIWPALAPAMLIGTAAGLVVKYLLDKRWIFLDHATGAAQHGQKFALYSLMGVATTLIFWGAEAGAWAVWHTAAARDIGAVAGLTLGYIVKFRLDRRFVFTDARLALARRAA